MDIIMCPHLLENMGNNENNENKNEIEKIDEFEKIVKADDIPENEWIEANVEKEESFELENSDEIIELQEDELEETKGGSGISVTSECLGQKEYSTDKNLIRISLAMYMYRIDEVMLWANSSLETKTYKTSDLVQISKKRSSNCERYSIIQGFWTCERKETLH